MEKKSLQLLFIAFLFLAQNSFAQELYMPRNIKESYTNGVRSMDGKPGKNYWQNHGKYDMALTVDANTKIVSGTETIVYENNSNDTLRNLRIRFVNNIHKKTSPRAVLNSEGFFTEGLTITNLKIEGEVYKEDAKSWGTVGSVKMKKPLPPHSKITIDIDWNYPLSEVSGREGQIDNTTFFVAYSYPRVSVFDDYNKWDNLPHTSGQEFYNDFNDYTYSVKAPKNYVVYGTGDLLNPDEVLQPEFAARLKKSYVTDEILHIANEQEMKSGLVTKQSDWNVWKFEAKNITDVCFGLSDHYLWDAGSVIVDKKTKRRASIQAAYDVKGTDFENSIKYNQYALDFFSHNWPGVPYPYSKMTAFQGFADMEYPMMCNDSQMGDPVFAQLVQDHEVAHTYFPFYMGINETRYAFMDEGWAKSTTDPYSPNPDVDVHELIRYGKEKNVGIILWLTWLTVENNFDLFKTFSEWGVKGVKIDFMDRSDQWMVNYYERVAKEAAKHNLFVDFHGSFKPAGLEYKYPNILSYEGVRGMEQMGGARPDNSVYFPFMRNAVGAMDYTPGAMLSMQPDSYAAERPNAASIGTRAYQMALFVIFESGLQMLGDNPTLYYRNPDCTEFITDVPVTWDETRSLAAEAGQYAIVAKRKGDQWYIGGMTNNKERERTFDLKLDFLKEGQSFKMVSFEEEIKQGNT